MIAGQVGVAAADTPMVVVEHVVARSAPSEAATIVFDVDPGAAVCVVEGDAVIEREGWRAVRLPGGADVGYVHARAATQVQASSVSARTCGVVPLVPVDAPADPALAPRFTVVAPADAVPPLPTQAGHLLPLQPVRYLFEIGSGRMSITEDAAQRHQIGKSGALLRARVGIAIYDMVTVAASGMAAFPRDDDSFHQTVVPVLGGDEMTAESSLALWIGELTAGIRTPFLVLSPKQNGTLVAVFAEVGTGGGSGKRSISDCRDCASDSLDLKGGGFWRTGIDLVLPFGAPGRHYALTAAYQRYFAGADLTEAIHVGLTISFSPTGG